MSETGAHTLDPNRLKLFSFTLFSKLDGAVTAAMVCLGDALGLYKALAAPGAPHTSHEIADRAGLDERWVREWLHNQAAARLIQFHGEAGAERFSLTPEAHAVLADEGHPAFALGMFQQLPAWLGILPQLQESFRTGIGLPYDALGAGGAESIERAFEPWYRHALVDEVLPQLTGVVERLERGARVADIGCGSGTALLVMAEAFPASEFHGYDISTHALDRAEANAREAKLANVRFHNAHERPLPADNATDFVTTFDCLHDMTDPAGMMTAIRGAIRDDGVWLLCDIKGAGALGANMQKNPMAAMMYGVSVLACMSSSLSEPGGAGLGTLGLHEAKAREMTAAAGFSRFRKLDVDHPVNAFYEVRV